MKKALLLLYTTLTLGCSVDAMTQAPGADIIRQMQESKDPQAKGFISKWQNRLLLKILSQKTGVGKEVLASKDVFPRIHFKLKQISEKMGMKSTPIAIGYQNISTPLTTQAPILFTDPYIALNLDEAQNPKSPQSKKIEGVLAHELAHIKHNHLLKKVGWYVGGDLSTRIPGYVLTAKLVKHLNKKMSPETRHRKLKLFLAALAGVEGTELIAHFSRNLIGAGAVQRYEVEADMEAAKLGYANSLASFLEAEKKRFYDKHGIDIEEGGWLDKHPSITSRIKALREFDKKHPELRFPDPELRAPEPRSEKKRGWFSRLFRRKRHT